MPVEIGAAFGGGGLTAAGLDAAAGFVERLSFTCAVRAGLLPVDFFSAGGLRAADAWLFPPGADFPGELFPELAVGEPFPEVGLFVFPGIYIRVINRDKLLAPREPRKKDVIPSCHSGQALRVAKDLDSSVAEYILSLRRAP